MIVNVIRKIAKWAILIVTLAVLVVFALPQTASAQSGSSTISTITNVAGNVAAGAATLVSNVTGKVIGQTVFYMAAVFVMVFGVFISVITFFIDILLQLNTAIPGTLFVQEGFKAFLSFANLAFVLGIIVIALATIVRSQTYGIKQLLRNLIIMAVAVNFSMAIASTIMGFSDGLTRYFMNGMSPGVPGTQTSQEFANKLAGAFQPQRLLMNNGLTITGVDLGGVVPNTNVNIASQLGSSLAGIFMPLINAVFVVLFFVAIVIVLVALLVMLLVRYVYLIILLVLMPLAWAGSVFPAFSGWWRQWWDKFIRYVFFPPVVVFFLYLAIATAGAMSNTTASGGGYYGFIYASANSPGSPIAAVKNIIGSFAGQFASTMAQMLVMLGLTIGGLFAAQKMGVELAGTAVKAAKGAGKGFGNYVGRRAGGGMARHLTTEPAEGKRPNALQRLAQSNLAKGFGVTGAMERYGDKTDLGKTGDIRRAASEKFRLAKMATGIDRERLENEGRALAALASKRRAESPGLFRSVAEGGGLWKKSGAEVTSKEAKVLSNLGEPGERRVMENIIETKEVPVLDDDGQPVLESGKPLMRTATEVKAVEKKVPVPAPAPLSGRAQSGIEAAKKFGQKSSENIKIAKEQLKQAGINVDDGSPGDVKEKTVEGDKNKPA